MTQDEIAAAWQEFKSIGSEAARNRLAEHYLPIVRHNAERFARDKPQSIEVDDLVSAGTFGLLQAIDAFDLTRGVKFETYCVPRIRGAMCDDMRKRDWVPRLVRNAEKAFTVAAERMTQELGRQPNAEELDVTPTTQVVSFSCDMSTDGRDAVRFDMMEDRRAESPAARQRRQDLLRVVARSLNRAERLIVILYYFERLTMREIGRALALSESRVSQMHTAIIDRLKRNLTPEQLYEHLQP